MTIRLTETIIGASIEVHRALGPGLLESAYQEALSHELGLRNVPFVRELALPVEYKGIHLDCSYRLDFLVDSAVVVEIKAIAAFDPVHKAQLMTYMKLGGWHVGLLINFNVPALRHGIRRIVL